MADFRWIFSDEDDIKRVNLKFDFADKTNQAITPSLDRTPLIAYDYIDIDEKTDYSFNQDNLEIRDFRSYFEIMKTLSSHTINQLMDLDYTYHFNLIHRPKKPLIDLLKEVSGKDYFDDQEMPVLGKVALYTNQNANRETGEKSPRIYFIIGHLAILHILFFDPFHEIT